MSNELPQFSIKQLLEAGVHFGHKTMRRNPKMTKYIHTNRNGVSIIDLNKTAHLLHNSLKVVRDIAKNNGRILFVATKKQAVETVAEAAKRCGQYYVNFRWLGGMLTNWKTISQSIKTLKRIEEKLADTEVGYNKKEKLVLQRQQAKLESALGGIKHMGGYPDLIFIIDTHKEALAIAEAKKINLPIMAILDTNCNPDGITYPIPGNDDSAKSIKLFCRLLSDAAIAGVKDNMAAAGIDVSKLAEEDIQTTIAKTKKTEAKPAAKKPEVKKEAKKKEFVKKTSAATPAEEKKAKTAAKKPAVKKAAEGKKPEAKAEANPAATK
jgi:small subunit ribosomal protein S2